nr:zinc finger, CCHC-type [Tanacetum cinerariifolium]
MFVLLLVSIKREPGSRVLWLTKIDQEEVCVVQFFWKEQKGFFCLGYQVINNKRFGVQVFLDVKQQQGIDRRLEDKQPEEKTNTDCLVKEQEKEYQTGWKIKMGNILDSCNQRSTQQCMKNVVSKHLGVVGIQQQNGLVDETNVTLFAKVLHGFKFEVEPLGDHTFEVEPQDNINQGAGLQEVQTQDLMDYQLARAEKIYAHESLTFNNTVACEVIFKWKAELKDDMDARSYVYVLSNGCKKCSDDIDGYYWGYTPGMFIHLFLYIDFF